MIKESDRFFRRRLNKTNVQTKVKMHEHRIFRVVMKAEAISTYNHESHDCAKLFFYKE